MLLLNAVSEGTVNSPSLAIAQKVVVRHAKMRYRKGRKGQEQLGFG